MLHKDCDKIIHSVICVYNHIFTGNDVLIQLLNVTIHSVL